MVKKVVGGYFGKFLPVVAAVEDLVEVVVAVVVAKVNIKISLNCIKSMITFCDNF